MRGGGSGNWGLLFFPRLGFRWEKGKKKVGEEQRGGIVALLGSALLSRVDGDRMGWVGQKQGVAHDAPTQSGQRMNADISQAGKSMAVAGTYNGSHSLARYSISHG